MVQGPGPREEPGELHGAHPPGSEHGGAEHAHGAEPDQPHDHHGFAATAEAIARRERRRRWRTGPLVALFTLALLTLSVELYLRLTDYRVRSLEHNITRTSRRWVALSRAHVFEEIDDPVRHYAMRPGAEAEIDGFHFRISAQRARGPDVAPAKPANEKRLLCLGDSFAFGLWCDEDETLAAEIGKCANAREAELGSGIHWLAIDLGVPGYHLGQTLRALEQDGLALEPDLVVLYTNTNDIEQSGFFYDDELGVLRRDYLPLPLGLRKLLWHGSYLYGAIAAWHTRAVEAGPTPYLDPRVPYAHVRADNQAYTRDCLARMAELCRARKLPLFVVNQPLMTFLGSTRRADWPVLPLDAWMRGVCRELGLPALDLLGWMRGYADGVDRFDQGVPPDFLLDAYFADERVQAALAWAQARAREAGKSWDELAYDQQLAFFAGYPEVLPSDPDFHLTGRGYAHIARLACERLRAEGLLP